MLLRGPWVMIRARDVLSGLQTFPALASLKRRLKKDNKMKALEATDARAPFGRYSHGVEIPAGWRVVKTSGQLGIRADESIPEDAYDQAVICFDTIRRILADAGMGPGDVAHVSAYVTDRSFFPAYMRARDEFIGETEVLPASTLLIVSGFTRPEFKVEVEVLAAAP
jgi:enamine deaminase RidA (YjgF/YER057c/UK114 family)